MRNKDIIKSLKSESESVKLPDVYSRAKSAPINKLLTGETPIQAFQKQLAVRLLAISAILIIALILSTAAYMLVPANVEAGNNSYVSITIAGGNRYGFVVSSDNNVIAAVLEKDGGAESLTKLNDAVGKDLNNAIKAVYVANNNDDVTICAISKKSDVSNYWATQAKDIVDSLYTIKSYASIIHKNGYIVEDELVTVINNKITEDKITNTTDADIIIDKYLALFR